MSSLHRNASLISLKITFIALSLTFILSLGCNNTPGDSFSPPEEAVAEQDRLVPPMPGVFRPLFNNKDLGGWSVTIDGQPKGVDPLRIFQVKQGSVWVYPDAVDGQTMPFGYMASEEVFSDFDLRFEYQWVGKRFAPRATSPRDAGLLYHAGNLDRSIQGFWPLSIECQIQESNTGDIWLVGSRAAVSSIESRYVPGAPVTIVGGIDEISRVAASSMAEVDGWNTVEVRARGNEQGIHVVNGKVNNRWESLQQWLGDWAPLQEGHLVFQAEGAEIRYRNISIRDGRTGPTGWQVHDRSRPLPPRMEPVPGKLPDLRPLPPNGAYVLFSGHGLDGWTSADGAPAPWRTQSSWFTVSPGTGDIYTRHSFGSVQVHLEFSEPAPASGSDQNRGNSGLFLMSKYEIQILDSYNNPTYADGMVGAAYGQNPPLAESLRPPGEWNELDIFFLRPHFTAEGKVIRPARVWAFINGVMVQDGFSFWGPTVFNRVATYHPHEDRLPLRLQDHGSPVRYRNIWAMPLRDTILTR